MAELDHLFSPENLDIDLELSSAKFNPKLTISEPGEGLKVRPLAKQDYEKGFLQVKQPLYLSCVSSLL